MIIMSAGLRQRVRLLLVFDYSVLADDDSSHFVEMHSVMGLLWKFIFCEEASTGRRRKVDLFTGGEK